MDEKELRVEALRIASHNFAGTQLLKEAEKIYQWLATGRQPDAPPELT